MNRDRTRRPESKARTLSLRARRHLKMAVRIFGTQVRDQLNPTTAR